jgi:hypothetical protein
MSRVLMLLSTLCLAAACSAPREDAPPRTPEQQRQVDSTIGASGLPGAQGVQGALRASDSAAVRRARLDSLAREP